MISTNDYPHENNESFIQPQILKKALLDDAFEDEILDFEELVKTLGASQQSFDIESIIEEPKSASGSLEMVKSHNILSDVYNNQNDADDTQSLQFNSSLDATQVDLDRFIMDIMETSTTTAYQSNYHHQEPTQHCNTSQSSNYISNSSICSTPKSGSPPSPVLPILLSSSSTPTLIPTTVLPTPSSTLLPAASSTLLPAASSTLLPAASTTTSKLLPTASTTPTTLLPATVHHTTKSQSNKPTANIPRHLRESHIRAERKRQSKIKNAREQLKDLLGLQRASENKIVEKAVERCRFLKAELVRMDNESSKLKKEKEALDADIDVFIKNLPPTLDDQRLTCGSSLTGLYHKYYSRPQNHNTKFNIFERIMMPLFQSYVEHVEKTHTKDEFNHGLQTWCKQNLSLISLRHKITFGLLDWQKSSNLVMHSPVVKASTKRQS